MVRIKLSGFKEFMLQRNRMFEYYTGLSDYKPPIQGIHLANNCRSIDATSQQLINIVNQEGAELLHDKMLTCLIYALYPQKELLTEFGNIRGLFSLDGIKELSERFRGEIKGEVLRTANEFMLSFNRSEDLVCCVESFLSNMPSDNFMYWRASEIKERFTKWYKSYMLTDEILDEFIQNLSYIDELHITLDYIEPLPKWLMDNSSFKALCIQARNGCTAKSFCEHIYKWYMTQEFPCDLEKEFSINDPIHAVIQYLKYLGLAPEYLELGRTSSSVALRNIENYRKAKTIASSKKTLHN